MSGGQACKCEEKNKPVNERNWVVLDRNCNYSAFNGYHRTYSDYSSISCGSCDASWRSKGNFVSHIKDIKQ